MSFTIQPVNLLFPTGRQIGSIKVNVIIQESTNDTLTVTKQPVQQGASIADHSYLEPTTLTMQILQANNLVTQVSLAKIYNDFLTLQSSGKTIQVMTPKRTYSSMMITSIGCTTDKKTENVLSLTVQFQQVIIVPVVATSVSPSSQATPQKTQATPSTGQSVLSKIFGG